MPFCQSDPLVVPDIYTALPAWLAHICLFTSKNCAWAKVFCSAVAFLIGYFCNYGKTLEENVLLKCSFDNFPHTEYMSKCMENCQKNILLCSGLFLLGIFVTMAKPWRKMFYWNVVLTIFHTRNICKNAQKTVRTTLQCIIVLKKKEKTMGQICFLVFWFLKFHPTPRDQ